MRLRHVAPTARAGVEAALAGGFFLGLGGAEFALWMGGTVLLAVVVIVGIAVAGRIRIEMLVHGVSLLPHGSAFGEYRRASPMPIVAQATPECGLVHDSNARCPVRVKCFTHARRAVTPPHLHSDMANDSDGTKVTFFVAA